MFMLSDRPDTALRLKSFSSATRGEKATIKIEIETTDMWALAGALKDLGDVQRGQKPPKASTRSDGKAAAQKRLALPSPRLALPSPEEE
ncbi:MAG: hypothetical protein CMP09_15825 [Yangia sp.]|nr:hypothetical protein [Salipiger sp.]